ncbi:MAG: TonB-dependent siderophore receptor [Ectothiorhodospiraceae bacterium]|nr:TonB-dependent siderophore receptor [Ectothiorhodospiraceae bacterium]
MTHANLRRALWLPGVSLLFLGGSAQPQDSGDQPAADGSLLPTLEVEARPEGDRRDTVSAGTRLEIPQQELPFSAFSIPSEIIEETQSSSLTEVMRYGGVTGGLDNFGNAGEFFSIRGFQLDNGNNYFRDGVRFRKYGYSPLFDLDRVEVLRGPASVLYGAVAPGGIVNFVTRPPSATPYTRIRLGAISEGPSWSVTGERTGPLNAEGSVRHRTIINREEGSGFRDFTEQEATGISSRLDWDLSNRTELALRISYFEDSRTADRGTTTVEDANGNVRIAPIPRDRFLGEPFTYNDYRDFNLGYELSHRLSSGWRLRQTTHAYWLDEDRLYLWGFGGGQGLNEPVAEDGVMNRTLGEWDADIRNLIMRLEADGVFHTGPLDHQLLVGVEGERFSNRRTNQRFDYDPIDIFNPSYRGRRPQTDAQTCCGPVSQKTHEYALYLQNRASLGDRYHLLLGGRFDYIEEENRLSGNREYYGAVSPQIGAVYMPVPWVSLYASYTESFQPQSGQDRRGRDFDPRRGEQIEVGTKLDLLDQRLFLTAAVFRLDWRNFLVTDPADPDFQRQSGLRQSRGAELGLSGEILPGWTAYGNYTWMERAEFRRDDNLQGNTVRNVPEHLLSLWTSYSPVAGSWSNFRLGGGLTVVGDRYGNDENEFRLGSYTLVDLALGYEPQPGTRLSLNVNNVFDETYYPGALFHRTISVGEPRNVRLAADIRF